MLCLPVGTSILPLRTFYKWLNRFDESNLLSLEDKSKAPINKRKPEYTPEEVERVMELRIKYPTLGKNKFHKIYYQEYQEEIKYWSVRRIITDYKLYTKRAIKNKRQKVQARILKKKRITELKTKPFTGFLLELDTIVTYFSNQKKIHFNCRR